MNAEKLFATSMGMVFPMKDQRQQSELDGLRNLDARVIGAVYDRYFTDVYRFVFYRLNDEKLAEDIASDTFVRLLEAIQKRNGPETNLKGWLLATASHAVTDHLRQTYRHPSQPFEAAIPHGDSSSLTDEMEHREMVGSVQQAYTCLTIEQQNVLAFRFGSGYSLEETARLMQKNINAVKALQFRALAALQRSLGEVAYE